MWRVLGNTQLWVRLMVWRGAAQTKAAELDARCAGYAGALQRAEREAVADKDCIAALRAAVARLHAQVRATPHVLPH